MHDKHENELARLEGLEESAVELLCLALQGRLRLRGCEDARSEKLTRALAALVRQEFADELVAEAIGAPTLLSATATARLYASVPPDLN